MPKAKGPYEEDDRARCYGLVVAALDGQPLNAGIAGCTDALRQYAICATDTPETAAAFLRALTEESVRMIEEDFETTKAAFRAWMMANTQAAGSA